MAISEATHRYVQYAQHRPPDGLMSSKDPEGFRCSGSPSLPGVDRVRGYSPSVVVLRRSGILTGTLSYPRVRRYADLKDRQFGGPMGSGMQPSAVAAANCPTLSRLKPCQALPQLSRSDGWTHSQMG